MLCLLSCLIQSAFSYIILILDLLDQPTCMSAVTKPTITCSVSRVVHTCIPAYTNNTVILLCVYNSFARSAVSFQPTVCYSK